MKVGKFFAILVLSALTLIALPAETRARLWQILMWLEPLRFTRRSWLSAFRSMNSYSMSIS